MCTPATRAGFFTLTIEHVAFVFHYADDEDAGTAIVDRNGPPAVIIDRLPTAVAYNSSCSSP